MTNNYDQTNEAPGWDAIDNALLPLYGTREPYQVGRYETNGFIGESIG